MTHDRNLKKFSLSLFRRGFNSSKWFGSDFVSENVEISHQKLRAFEQQLGVLQPRYSDVRRRGNQYGFAPGVSVKPLFRADHPLLVNDGVENGWSQFSFTGNNFATTRSTLLGLCAVSD